MRAINLLPRDEERARLEGLRMPLLVLAGGLAVATAAAVALAAGASGTAEARRTELATLEATIDRLPKAPRPAVSQSVLAQERSNRLAALAAALGSRTAFDRALREIALVLPDDVWLTGLRAVAPAAATPASGGPPAAPPSAAGPAEGLTIEGAAFTHGGVARALARLSALPSLADVRLTSSALAEQQAAAPSPTPGSPPPARRPGKQFVVFTISASLAAGGPR